jgi:hypothetical protein
MKKKSAKSMLRSADGDLAASNLAEEGRKRGGCLQCRMT